MDVLDATFIFVIVLFGKEEVLIKIAKSAKVGAPRTAKVGKGNEVGNFKIGASHATFF